MILPPVWNLLKFSLTLGTKRDWDSGQTRAGACAATYFVALAMSLIVEF